MSVCQSLCRSLSLSLSLSPVPRADNMDSTDVLHLSSTLRMAASTRQGVATVPSTPRTPRIWTEIIWTEKNRGNDSQSLCTLLLQVQNVDDTSLYVIHYLLSIVFHGFRFWVKPRNQMINILKKKMYW